jgi:hypothetical protein
VSADVTFLESTSYFSSSSSNIDGSSTCLPRVTPLSPIIAPEKPLQVYSCQCSLSSETSSLPADSPQAPTETTPQLCDLPDPDSNSVSIALRKGKDSFISDLISQFVSYAHLSPSLRAFTLSVPSMVIPKSVLEILFILGWNLENNYRRRDLSIPSE